MKPYSLERKPKPRSIGGDLFIVPTKRTVGVATASQIYYIPVVPPKERRPDAQIQIALLKRRLESGPRSFPCGPGSATPSAIPSSSAAAANQRSNSLAGRKLGLVTAGVRTVAYPRRRRKRGASSMELTGHPLPPFHPRGVTTKREPLSISHVENSQYFGRRWPTFRDSLKKWVTSVPGMTPSAYGAACPNPF